MKKLTLFFVALCISLLATANNHHKILIAYFSWGGNTRTVAEYIAEQTQGELFRIEPVVPYPSQYTPCTEVALEERDSNARPAIKEQVANWDDYDVIFIGCPVWWHEAPMIIHTFAESYNFEDKTVVPFCTYAATYRDETLAKIVEITPAANHLEGYGVSGRSTRGVSEWLDRIGMMPSTGIDDIVLDDNAEIRIFDLNGILVYEGKKTGMQIPGKGLYILHYNNKSEKVIL